MFVIRRPSKEPSRVRQYSEADSQQIDISTSHIHDAKMPPISENGNSTIWYMGFCAHPLEINLSLNF